MMNIHRRDKDQKSYADMLGIGSALLCLIHCLATPVLMGLGVNFEHTETSFFLHEFWEIIFLFLGLLAVYFSSKHSPTKFIRILLWGTYISLAASILLHENSPFFQYLVYTASLALILAHIYSFRKVFKA